MCLSRCPQNRALTSSHKSNNELPQLMRRPIVAQWSDHAVTCLRNHIAMCLNDSAYYRWPKPSRHSKGAYEQSAQYPIIKNIGQTTAGTRERGSCVIMMYGDPSHLAARGWLISGCSDSLATLKVAQFEDKRLYKLGTTTICDRLCYAIPNNPVL